MRAIEWTASSLDDMAKLDREIARRIKQAVERFAATGAGNVKRPQGIDPPEYCPRIGDWRIRFNLGSDSLSVLRVRNRKDVYR